jgi:hypothetical protein
MGVDWTQLLQSGAQLAGAAGAARAKGRADESTALNQRDQTANSLYNTAQNAQMQSGQLDLQRQQAAQQMAGKRTQQATAADLLSRMQDVSINVPGIHNATVTGGIRPSAMGDIGRTSNALLAKQALMKQLEGDSFSGGQILTPPSQSAMPQGNFLDTLLNTGGLVGSLGGAALGAMSPDRAAIPNISSFAGLNQAPGENLGMPGMPTSPDNPSMAGADVSQIQKIIDALGQQRPQAGY